MCLCLLEFSAVKIFQPSLDYRILLVLICKKPLRKNPCKMTKWKETIGKFCKLSQKQSLKHLQILLSKQRETNILKNLILFYLNIYAKQAIIVFSKLPQVFDSPREFRFAEMWVKSLLTFIVKI